MSETEVNTLLTALGAEIDCAWDLYKNHKDEEMLDYVDRLLDLYIRISRLK